MGFFTPEFLAKRRVQWMNTIKKFEYKVGSTWYEAVIKSREVNGNAIKFLVHIPNNPATSHVISSIRIKDATNTVCGSREIGIERSSTQGVLLSFEFPIQEV